MESLSSDSIEYHVWCLPFLGLFLPPFLVRTHLKRILGGNRHTFPSTFYGEVRLKVSFVFHKVLKQRCKFNTTGSFRVFETEQTNKMKRETGSLSP